MQRLQIRLRNVKIKGSGEGGENGRLGKVAQWFV